MNILEIKRMDFCYKQRFVLKNFELSVKEGSVYGLIGKPKSGKTTVLKLILGLLKTTSSTIFLKGQNFYGCRDKIQGVVGNIIDLPYYQNFLTVRENFKYIDMLFGYGDLRITQVLRFIGLYKYTNTKVRKLTAAQQKCLSIGIALYHDPDFLVFDDLLRDLDEDSRISVCKLLVKIKDLGKTILLSSRHYIELSSVCTHIGLLESGRISKEGRLVDFIESDFGDLIPRLQHYQL
ncbi:ABC transporter ATP-binding protein [Dysgonomonas sp. HDW5A]|uniref:ATP-binding cassette domain-containing protein n=1 Tax=Dysgonomonas sp. HDW5A TaxID=2714926 RepID=UPI00140CBF3E|nr:ATP-binding cassette domain-containing protein [Dysgonomonas sp. HDW5A]QIK60095.1 ABC transporter ATP-binding protein [Dysgonomonas sp. HDW5A]